MYFSVSLLICTYTQENVCKCIYHMLNPNSIAHNMQPTERLWTNVVFFVVSLVNTCIAHKIMLCAGCTCVCLRVTRTCCTTRIHVCISPGTNAKMYKTTVKCLCIRRNARAHVVFRKGKLCAHSLTYCAHARMQIIGQTICAYKIFRTPRPRHIVGPPPPRILTTLMTDCSGIAHAVRCRKRPRADNKQKKGKRSA